MRSMLPRSIAALVAAIALALPALADGKAVEAPAPVKAAVEKAYPGAKIETCKEDEEDGKKLYELKIETKDAKKIELDVTAGGKIVAIEERIDLAAVPAAVSKTLAAKYPGAKATAAAKVTDIDEKDDKIRVVSYEIAIDTGKEHKEATFAEDGTFLEEESD